MYGRGRGRRDDNSGSSSSSWRNGGPPQKESKLDDWNSSSHVDRQPGSRPQTNTDEWDDWTRPSDQQANTGRSSAVAASTEGKMETNWDDWGSNSQPSQSQQSGTQSYRREADMSNDRRGRESWSNNSSGAGRRSDSQHRERQQPAAGSTIVIRVPNGTVGRVIGKGGAKINELQEQTGAKIRVLRDDDNGVDTGVQIVGSADQQKQAEQLIKELTENTNPYPGSRFSNTQSMNSASSRPMDNAVEDVATIDWGAVIKNSIEATKKRWANCPPICKNFYVEDPEISTMRREEIEEFRLTHNKIMASHYKADDDRPIPNPVMKFEQAFGHFPELLAAVKNQKFSEPSPIQTQAWPILLKGHDLIGIAQTGTGKTLAFLLPALIHIEGQPIPREQRDGPTVLIMAPTRELAQQIEREVAKFPYKGIKCVCVYGGGDRREQIGKVARGVEIVVATPGRLYDLMSAGALKTSSVSYVVLDEADRMLDQGFEPEIKKILIDVRPDKQMIMTSATWPEGIRRIANDYMDNPLQVCVGTMDLAAVHSVAQHVEIMAEEDKRQRLMDFIATLGPNDKAIVFVGRKIVADQVASELSLVGIACQCIHGDRDQLDREQALADLRTGDVKLLIATDVASRGIDIKDITHILNYDFPRHAEEYVHRVGRTGRAGATGIAISFMTREDWSKAEDLINILREAGQEIPAELHSMAERFGAWKERKDEERKRNQLDAGGRGSSSGRGGASGRGCFKCGEEGHMSRECPSGGGRGGGGRGGGRGRGGSRRGGFDDFF